MPFINIRVLKGTLSEEKKKEMILRITEIVAEIEAAPPRKTIFSPTPGVSLKRCLLKPVSSKRSMWHDLEREFILQVLKENNWSRNATAKDLGIGRQTLWRKIKRLNIEAPKR